MVIRIILLLLSFIILVNLCIIAFCYVQGENLYKKYGKQLIIAFACFILIIAAVYTAIALIGLK